MNKQAILLIHGIGEQKPMDTLRGFVKTMWTRNLNAHISKAPYAKQSWSKPDSISESFELRRLTTPKNKEFRRTDFYEFYWAHLMSGTDVSHVFGWFKFLLLRDPRELPRKLIGIYVILLLGIVISLLFLINTQAEIVEIPKLLSFVIGAALMPALTVVLKKIVGDAARYLYPSPTNIQKRHAIRSAGVSLLKKLHDRGYTRIVVVGHSLGSVIGYDILNHTFSGYHARHGCPDSPQSDSLIKLEEMAAKDEWENPEKINRYQELQHDYLEELRANGNPWRVSDFITLGSPLAHAEVLMASNPEDFLERKQARELPTCPPVLEETVKDEETVQRFSFAKKYETNDSEKKIRVPHHGAVFAPTRWTNLYFPSRWIVKGDFISGPLRSVFGNGIRDVTVKTKKWNGFISHTFYWKETREGESPEPHIQSLREAVRLTEPNPMSPFDEANNEAESNKAEER